MTFTSERRRGGRLRCFRQQQRLSALILRAFVCAVQAAWRPSDDKLGKFAFVAPSAVLTVAPPVAPSGATVVDVHGALPSLEQAAAVMVQLAAGSCTYSLPLYASSMRRASTSPTTALLPHTLPKILPPIIGLCSGVGIEG